MTLASKIAQASMAIGTLEPDKRNDFQKYDYLSANKILARAGAALAEQGVALVPAVTEEESWYVEYGNKSRWDSRVMFFMTVTDGEETLTATWAGRGSDSAVPDKAMYKAITSGHKYFLMKLLNIGEGNEDGEHENIESLPQRSQNTARTQPEQKDVDFSSKPGVASVARDTGKGWISVEDGAGEAPPLYVIVRQHMMQTHQALMTGAAAKAEGRPASAAQYKFLAGTIDSLTDGMHGVVLSALCNFEVSKDNPPSSPFCSDLLNVLLEQSKDKETGEYVDNPKFSPTQVDNIRAIAAKAKELGA